VDRAHSKAMSLASIVDQKNKLPNSITGGGTAMPTSMSEVEYETITRQNTDGCTDTFKIEVLYWAKDDRELWLLTRDESIENEMKRLRDEREQEAEAKRKEEHEEKMDSLEASFSVFDEDGSGFLETKEVLAILTRMTPASCQLSMDDAKAFIELFDRDGADGEDKDGKISFKEFVNMMNSMSKKHDTVKKTGAETKSEDFAEKLADGHEAKKYRDDDSIKMDTGLRPGQIKEGVDAVA